MKVILTERIPSLGNTGEVVNVSPGYARNYLLPRSLGVVADEGNVRQSDHYKRLLASKVAKEEARAREEAGSLEGLELEFVRKVGPGGKIFSPVTPGVLSRELAGKGIDVPKRSILMDGPARSPGEYTARDRKSVV